MNITERILAERQRQIDVAHGGDTNEFDKGNTCNDWVAYIATYNGRATRKGFSNGQEKGGFVDNMIKVAALAIAAIEAHEKGWCK